MVPSAIHFFLLVAFLAPRGLYATTPLYRISRSTLIVKTPLSAKIHEIRHDIRKHLSFRKAVRKLEPAEADANFSARTRVPLITWLWLRRPQPGVPHCPDPD